MLYSTFLVAATAFTGFVSAQSTSNTQSSSGAQTTSGAQNQTGTQTGSTGDDGEGQYTIDPNSVDLSERQNWCRAQFNTCNSVCGGQAFPNECDATTLSYTCVCTNGNMPNISSYDQSLAAYECREWRQQCVQRVGDDAQQQQDCINTQCGSREVSDASSSSSSSMASMTATSSSSGSDSTSSASTTAGAGGSSDSDSDSDSNSDSDSDSSASGTASSSAAAASQSDSGAAAMRFAQSYGTGVLATGLLAFFGLAL
ncbi:hypothetical protein KC318_g12838 [Hortaea werneckii]|nr:hypothetical protein KC334_g12978 [Hortaea werneckii]KAI7011296.1 hypothetical protein KC355_g5817 [Hortaea werneckii]KAI7655717.1 hypothetical protein KC318_g12838 [Hortaea werneckii]RMY00353.1 hypothetical protein D0868_09050 [Hortaea werneckii]RMY29366.1 hypothetical protein D0866_08745 [Hortaea werneckii]